MGTLQVWGWVVNLSSSKKPDSSSFKAYTHKTCIIKQKIDIKTCQKHRYNTIPLFRNISFPVITLSYLCFLSITLVIFRATVKLCNILCTVHDYRLFSEEICNEYAAQTMFFPETSLFDWKKSNCIWLFLFPKKPKVFKINQILATLARMFHVLCISNLRSSGTSLSSSFPHLQLCHVSVIWYCYIDYEYFRLLVYS